MDAPKPPPTAASPKPCCVCDEPGGKHCTKCKSRHYCSKKCQLVDWKEGGHKEQCKQLAAKFQDQLLDELIPEKLEIKEEPPIVEDVAPAAGFKAAARLPAARMETTAVVKATTVNGGTPDWRGACAICLNLLPVGANSRQFYSCCCKKICIACCNKCQQYDDRCPFCRAPICNSNAEWLCRVQKHVDKGHAEAQEELASVYYAGDMGLKQSFKRAFQLYGRSAAQGYAIAQHNLGGCYNEGHGVKIDYKVATRWFQRAAEQGLVESQYNTGMANYEGKGVAQSYDEAARWWRLAAAQGNAHALFNLGACLENGEGVPRDVDAALRFYIRAAAKEHAGAAAEVERLKASLAAARPR